MIDWTSSEFVGRIESHADEYHQDEAVRDGQLGEVRVVHGQVDLLHNESRQERLLEPRELEEV